MKPMKAPSKSLTEEQAGKLTYPVMCSPKMDGIRSVIQGGMAMSNSLKLIPNEHTQKIIASAMLGGVDGELIVGDVTAEDVYHTTHSGVMRKLGYPAVKFHIFDIQLNKPYHERLALLPRYAQLNQHVVITPTMMIDSVEQLLSMERYYLDLGYEGMMIRDPNGRYKSGRATLKESLLLKFKRFEDSEAEILGYSELMHNKNKAKVNELGQSQRSSHKGGKVGGQIVGSLDVRDVYTGVEFSVGVARKADRASMWKERDTLAGKIIKYKYFPVGVKDKPRHPTFLGFRDKRDMT